MSGLTEEQARIFWNDRAVDHGVNATGPVGPGHGRNQQDLDYAERKSWLIPLIGAEILARDVLDYGCGTGRYANIWGGRYIGVDVSKEMVAIAHERVIDKMFCALKDPWLPLACAITCNVFFSATVLQHCDDALLKHVFESCRQLTTLSTFVLYENSEQMGGFMRGRTSEDYVKVLKGKGWTVEACQSWSHVFHTSRHTLTVIQV